MCACTLRAATATWDTTVGDMAPIGGAGVWNTTNTNWTTNGGTTNTAWVGGDDALFTGTGGLVSVAQTLTAGTVGITGTGYTLEVGNVTLTASTVNMNTGNTLSFASGFSTLTGNLVLGTDSKITLQSAGFLNGLISGTGGLAIDHPSGTGKVLNQSVGSPAVPGSLNNSYTGNTTIANNVLRFDHFNATSFNPFGSTANATVKITNGGVAFMTP